MHSLRSRWLFLPTIELLVYCGVVECPTSNQERDVLLESLPANGSCHMERPALRFAKYAQDSKEMDVIDTDEY
jgi:hypothetical protein